MMSSSRVFFLAATFVAANSLAASKAIDGIEYTDEKQCHVKIAGSDLISPVIPMLVAAHSMEKNQAAIRVAIDTSLRQGCDINEVDLSGLQPLNSAILFADPVMVTFLLEKGADPYALINRPNTAIDRLNSFDFLAAVKKKWEERGDKKQLSQYPALLKALEKFR